VPQAWATREAPAQAELRPTLRRVLLIESEDFFQAV
jgi:hypothetical protein